MSRFIGPGKDGSQTSGLELGWGVKVAAGPGRGPDENRKKGCHLYSHLHGKGGLGDKVGSQAVNPELSVWVYEELYCQIHFYEVRKL